MLGKGGRAHVGLDADGGGNAAAMNGAKGFRPDSAVAVVEAEAAKFNRLADAEEPGLAGLLEQFVARELLDILPFLDVGIDLGIDEAPQGATQFLVFGAKKH